MVSTPRVLILSRSITRCSSLTDVILNETQRTTSDNVASVRVLERAGMRRERHALKALWHHELGWLDEVEYAILADEWGARS